MAVTDPATPIFLTPNLSYPISISQILVTPSTNVQRGTPLFHYSFEYILPLEPSSQIAPNAPRERRMELRFGTFESPVDGLLDAWAVKQGQKITRDQATRTPVVTISEECTHTTQWGGMCAVCGKDVTTYVVLFLAAALARANKL
jgi:RNA polymerase II subunit A C-terminal domain phosphatase